MAEVSFRWLLQRLTTPLCARTLTDCSPTPRRRIKKQVYINVFLVVFHDPAVVYYWTLPLSWPIHFSTVLYLLFVFLGWIVRWEVSDLTAVDFLESYIQNLFKTKRCTLVKSPSSFYANVFCESKTLLLTWLKVWRIFVSFCVLFFGRLSSFLLLSVKTWRFGYCILRLPQVSFVYLSIEIIQLGKTFFKKYEDVNQIVTSLFFTQIYPRSIVSFSRSNICLCLPPDSTWHKVKDPKVGL